MISVALKERTKKIHQESEKELIPHLKQVSSPEDYIRLLNWLYGYYAPLEEQVRLHITADILPDAEKRWRTDNLLRDMEAIGIPLPPPDTCTDLPVIDSPGKAIGALYVLEGSTLGGRIIASMLAKQLGSVIAISYFSGYGNETETMWHSFKAFLDDPTFEREQEPIFTGAQETFLTFKNWIEKHAFQPQL